MKFIEAIDRWHDRAVKYREVHPRKALDGKLFLGGIFILSYFGIVLSLLLHPVPTGNDGLIRDALLVLGPPVGAIVNAIWRTDARDEQQAKNTAEGFKALGKQAEATTAAAQAGTGQSTQD